MIENFCNISELRPLNDRKISILGYVRPDGDYEIHGEIIDYRQYNTENKIRGAIPMGDKMHHMQIILHANRHMKIINIDAQTFSAPFAQYCSPAANNYKALIGLTIASGFKQKIIEILGKNKQCTHISELLPQMATCLFQTMHADKQVKDQENQNANKTTTNKNINPGAVNNIKNSCYGFQDGGYVLKALLPNTNNEDN